MKHSREETLKCDLRLGIYDNSKTTMKELSLTQQI